MYWKNCIREGNRMCIRACLESIMGRDIPTEPEQPGELTGLQKVQISAALGFSLGKSGSGASRSLPGTRWEGMVCVVCSTCPGHTQELQVWGWSQGDQKRLLEDKSSVPELSSYRAAVHVLTIDSCSLISRVYLSAFGETGCWGKLGSWPQY